MKYNNDMFGSNANDIYNNDAVKALQVKCRVLTVERVYTPGFTITADQYEGFGPFTTVIHISYTAGANKTVSIVQVRAIGSDVCIRDVLLDSTGKANAADYNVSDTHMIYAIIKDVTVGGNVIQCCNTFDYTNCPNSNYIRFTVTDTGNIQFLSDPSSASIWLAPTGQTPTDTTNVTPDTISSLPVGDYDYILKLTNFNDYISPQPVIVVKNQTAIVGPIGLVPAEGCIYLKSNPPGAQIFLNATPMTVVDTGFVTPKLICGLSSGQHCYKLVLSGYEDNTGCVTLGIGNGERVSTNLIELPVLTDIIISPLNPTVAVGQTRAFSASPIDQYGNPFPAIVTWSSSNTYVGIINPDNGVFSAEHEGSTVISATSGLVVRTTTATVTTLAPVLDTIIVSPATVSIAIGNAAIFTASPLDQFGNPITATIIWSSSDSIVGTIDQSGIFNALSVGSTVISATSESIIGIAIANVTTEAVAGFMGVFGNINTAAFVIGLAMIGAVLLAKPQKIEIIERKELAIPPHRGPPLALPPAPIPEAAPGSKPLSDEDRYLIRKLKEKGATGTPICTGEQCRMGKWVAIAQRGEPIIIHDP